MKEIKITRNIVMDLIKVPHLKSEKRDMGTLIIIAGVGGMAGAGILSAFGALRSGAGVVNLVTKKDNFLPVNSFLPECICRDVDTYVDKLVEGRELMDAIAIGPGIGTDQSSKKILEKILRNLDLPLVLDADGLNLVSKSKVLKKLVKDYPGAMVITPHEREAMRLLSIDSGKDEIKRSEVALSLSEEYNCVALLKGNGTLVTDGKTMYRNTTGNPGMATAGSGDVLTGVIGAFMAMGIDALDAALLGAYLHGRSGDIAAKELGCFGLIARDIAGNMPFAIKEIVNE